MQVKLEFFISGYMAFSQDNCTYEFCLHCHRYSYTTKYTT